MKLDRDTRRTPIASITAVLLPFVTYLLTLPRTCTNAAFRQGHHGHHMCFVTLHVILVHSPCSRMSGKIVNRWLATKLSGSESELLFDWRFNANQFILAPSPLRFTTTVFFWQLNHCCHCPYVTSLTRGWVSLL
jgi:hypothetical protein